MHILYLPSFYPDINRPVNGLFFKNLSKAVVGKVDKVGTIYVEQKSLRSLVKTTDGNLWQKSIQNDEGILTYKLHGVNLLNQHFIGSKIWMFLTKKLIEAYIEENGKPDFIHAHNVFDSGKVAFNTLKKYNIPYLITEHASGFLLNEYSAKQLKIASKVYKNARQVIAVSENLALAIKSSCSVSSILIIPNVIDTSMFKLNSEIRKRELFTFISVGNLLLNKGHHILIRAFKEFHSKETKAQLLIFGDGPELNNLQRLIKALDLTETVFLKGKIVPEDLVIEYQKSHCLILPSFKETFGVVLIEAMACGIPVIATKSGGPESLVTKENGLLVEAGDFGAMSNAMLNVYTDYSHYDKQSINSFANVNFGKNDIGEKMTNLYSTLK
jgi:glycosyltransferase involved in cell wall biosynthesis